MKTCYMIQKMQICNWVYTTSQMIQKVEKKKYVSVEYLHTLSVLLLPSSTRADQCVPEQKQVSTNATSSQGRRLAGGRHRSGAREPRRKTRRRFSTIYQSAPLAWINTQSRLSVGRRAFLKERRLQATWLGPADLSPAPPATS